MQRSPRTTVVIAAWGGYVGAQLDEAVGSIRKQEVPVRLVIVDNSSEPALPDRDGAEIVHSGSRMALGAARNLGVARVRTPFVLVWDADDVMLPGTLGRLEQRLEDDPRLAAFGAAIVEDPSGRRHRWPRRWVAPIMRVPWLFALLHCVWSLFPTTGATLMRTDLVQAAGGYAETDSGEDWVLGVSLAFRGRIGWSEQPGRLYRIHSESVLTKHIGARHLLRQARSVRGRLRDDAGLPRWAHAIVPLIAVAQYAAIGVHLGLGYSRRLRRSRERSAGEGRA